MSKQTVQNVRVGQLNGVKLIIKKIHNDGLQESVSIKNQGTVAQPMSGWILASLRGQVFYTFPDNLICMPGKVIIVHSGLQTQVQGRVSLIVQNDFFWTNEQVWNNHGDMAILFDADGNEVDRYAYPYKRVMGSSAEQRRMLIQHSDGYQIIDAPAHQTGRTNRHTNIFTN